MSDEVLRKAERRWVADPTAESATVLLGAHLHASPKLVIELAMAIHGVSCRCGGVRYYLPTKSGESACVCPKSTWFPPDGFARLVSGDPPSVSVWDARVSLTRMPDGATYGSDVEGEHMAQGPDPTMIQFKLPGPWTARLPGPVEIAVSYQVRGNGHGNLELVNGSDRVLCSSAFAASDSPAVLIMQGTATPGQCHGLRLRLSCVSMNTVLANMLDDMRAAGVLAETEENQGEDHAEE